jgi:aquaglyceroporin related protein
MLLVLFGSASGCQVVLSTFPKVSATPKGEYLSVALGYAAGISLGVWVASGSGGHINPAVTLAFAYLRRFPWKKVPIYILSQVLGGMVGTLIAWGNYMHAINIVDPGKTRLTASFFAIYGQNYLPASACFFSEFLGAALLVMVIFAVLDKRNGPPPAGLVPLVLFILFIGLGACLGMNTAFGVNPARDLGPRIALSMLGYSSSVVWNYRSQFWLWTGTLAPILGALCGGAFYDFFLYTGDDSIFSPTYFKDSTGEDDYGVAGPSDIV